MDRRGAAMKELGYLLYLIVAPFLFAGLIQRVKAIWAGRKGAPLLQPLYDWIKLLRKGEVVSSVASFVFRIGGSVYLASVLTASLLIAFPRHQAFLSFAGDFVLFAYLLGLGRFFLVISAMDTGSPFEGMGASREVTFAALVEPAFFILVGSLALLTRHTSFATIFAGLDANAEYALLVKGLGILALFIMLLVEGSRVPVDDPNTHLELTMIHEVMVLDHSGPNLAYILYGTHLKMLLIAVGRVESWMARTRMSHNPQFIFVMSALALIVFAAAVYFIHGGM
jgi:formate hydrogenlyase subunit 4